MSDIMEGTNRRGRKQENMLDDIQEWCRMDLYIVLIIKTVTILFNVV